MSTPPARRNQSGVQFTEQLLPQLRTDRLWDTAEVAWVNPDDFLVDIVIQGAYLQDIPYLDTYLNPRATDNVICHYGGGLMYIQGRIARKR